MKSGGFLAVEERDLSDIDARGRLYRHPSGAELLSLRKDDPTRVFGVAFRTLPSDSTGVAHILEHSVLCGSSRYPVKKPFVELLKGSLQTFLNAVTLPDLTCYPVASPNETDFYNLVRVYLDAVFAPKLSPETFRQEAWRLEPDASGGVSLQGVVYNEMKGHVSSPLGVLSETIRRSLFPDTTYGVGYGGDWDAIPDLTHEALVSFHRRFYTPSNALFFFYGPDAPTWQFDLVAEYLEGSTESSHPHVLPQEAFSKPRRTRARYPGVRRKPRADGFIAMAWALETGMDRACQLRWSVLDRLLVGAPTALLRRALVETGLGDDLVLSGVSHHTLQPTFQVGLSGSDPGAADRVEAAVLDCLRDAAEGLRSEDVEAAVNSVEFALREGATGHLPEGIRHMMAALVTWPRGGDPLDMLNFESALTDIRRRIATGEPVLEDLLRELLVATHRVTVILEADPDKAAEDAATERRRVEALTSPLGPEPADRLAEESRSLRQAQDRPDPAEALASLPVLRLADLPEEVPADPLESRGAEGRTWLAQERPTRGLLYLDLGFDLSGLPDEALPAARLLGTALLETGTARRDYLALGQWIGSATGGVAPQNWAAAERQGGAAARLFLRGKVLASRAEELCAILEEVTSSARLDDSSRLREVVLQEKARAEARLVPAGHETVDHRVRAALNRAGRIDEAMNGASYLRFLQDAAERLDTLGPQLIDVRDRLLATRPVCSVTADGETLNGAGGPVESLLAALERPTGSFSDDTGDVPSAPTAEGLVTQAQVNFVGLGGDLHASGLAPSGATDAVARYLANTWLWDRVRVQGGAYGAVCRFDPVAGTISMISYRDPNVLATLGIYQGAGAYLASSPSQRDLTSSIIATIGALDRPRPAEMASFLALQRRLSGQDESWRNARRQQLLAATPEDFSAFGAALDKMAKRVVVLGGAEALARVEAERPGWLTRTRVT